ncbi:MAG: hypothetical protein KBG20_11165 [Caldilineaceae bacterium]|nr:hypothetical protein [Caldilineaceae bacterium]MBP8108060.1 hypothetical protein [Caldilineaceae bacterium]MBP8125094.1 hypothetical protein [Caldilineaceae bacterium]MBP9072855.1 hypothetical protein [Caldilineaceae bacterium]
MTASSISPWSGRRFPEQRLLVQRARALAQALKSHLRTQEGADQADNLEEARFLLQAAQELARPLSERLRILGLMAASLDNLFILEMPALQDALDAGETGSRQRLQTLASQVQPMVDQAAAFITKHLLPELAQTGIRVRTAPDLLWEQRSWVRGYFQSRVYPLLTPLAVDPGRPFPFISTHSLNVLVQLPQDSAGQRINPRWQPLVYARIKVPRMLPRFVPLPGLGGGPTQDWMWSEDLVRFSVPELFQGMEVTGAYLFRVLRSGSQLTSSPSFMGPIIASRKEEKLAQVVRLDVEATMPAPMIDWLVNHLEVPPVNVFRIPGPLSLVQFVDLANIVDGISVPRPA